MSPTYTRDSDALDLSLINRRTGLERYEAAMAIYVDDRELVAAHRAGDTEAFDELVREHRLQLLAHANRKLRCDAAAQDALQETLVRAYKSLPKFNGEYRLGPWLHRIMANVCVDEAHRRHRDSEKTSKFATQSARLFEAPSAEDELGLNFDGAELIGALDDLPGSHREALVLRVVDELEYSEVAERTGVSEQNARARVSRARSAIRAAVKGVALVPAMFAVLLKRGEKAAAAATSAATTTAAVGAGQSASATLPAVVDATIAVPIVAKAAMGVGLAAAVLTPTSDSALHQAVENMGVPEFGTNTGVSLNEADAAILASEAVLPADPSDLSVSVTIGESAEAASPAETLSPSGDALVEATRSEISEQQVVVLPPAEPTGRKSRVSIAALDVTPRGSERYELSGSLELIVAEVSYAGVLRPESALRVASGMTSDELRLEALLMLELNDGQTIEIQLAGLAANTAPVLDVSGIYRTNVVQYLGMGTAGWFRAELNSEGMTAPQSLVVDLES